MNAVRPFVIAAAASLVAGGALFAAHALGQPWGDPIPFVVGTGAFAFGAFFVRSHPSLAPDPAFRKGVAPRAFWALVVGILLRGAVAGEPEQGFLAAVQMAGVLLEAAALGMLLYGAFARPAEKPAPQPNSDRIG